MTRGRWPSARGAAPHAKERQACEMLKRTGWVFLFVVSGAPLGVTARAQTDLPGTPPPGTPPTPRPGPAPGQPGPGKPLPPDFPPGAPRDPNAPGQPPTPGAPGSGGSGTPGHGAGGRPGTLRTEVPG